METPVEIRYAGVVVARANEVRRMTVGGVDLFLAMPEPLPAGTLVSLGADQHARVEKVVESTDPSVAGVYVRLLSEGEVSQPWVPCFREAEVPAPRPPAVVVSPVIVRPVHAPAPPRASVPTPREVVLPVRAPEPRVEREPETPLPEVVASVVEAPRVEVVAPKPFTSPLPQPNEQIALFETVAAPQTPPPEPPPPAVIEHAPATKRDRKRSTIVVAVAPAADEERVSGAVKAVGEIDTGSRRVAQAVAPDHSQGRPSIMVEADDYHQPAPPVEAQPEPAHDPDPEGTRPTTDLRLEDLSVARPLPASARGRATKRRRTTQR